MNQHEAHNGACYPNPFSFQCDHVSFALMISAKSERLLLFDLELPIERLANNQENLHELLMPRQIRVRRVLGWQRAVPAAYQLAIMDLKVQVT